MFSWHLGYFFCCTNLCIKCMVFQFQLVIPKLHTKVLILTEKEVLSNKFSTIISSLFLSKIIEENWGTKGEFRRPLCASSGRFWKFMISLLKEYDLTRKVIVGPCGERMIRRFVPISDCVTIIKCDTPSGPAIFMKSFIRLLFFTSNRKNLA